jgi:hypothetical protein
MLPFTQPLEPLAFNKLKVDGAPRDHGKQQEEENFGCAQPQVISSIRASHGKTMTWPFSGSVSPKRLRDIASKRSGDVKVAHSTLSSRFSCSS